MLKTTIKQASQFTYVGGTYQSAGLMTPVVVFVELNPGHPFKCTTAGKEFGGFNIAPIDNHNVKVRPQQKPA